MENMFNSIWGDVLNIYTDDLPEVDKELLNKFSDFMMQSSRERAAREKAEYEEKRKSFTWTIEEWAVPEEFDDIYKEGKYYLIVNNKDGFSLGIFSFRADEIKKYEEELNSKCFIELHKVFKDKTSDKIMEECYGKDWKKTHSPYHLYTYSVIFDTELGAIIYETAEEAHHHSYIFFYNNIAEIIQERHDTVYFDMKNRKELITGKYDKVESNDYIILGKSHYYHTGKEKERATIINKHTGEITTLY